VANYTFDGTVSVLLSNGDGTFQPAQAFPAGSSPRSVAVGDFNGDGKLDLAVANYGSNTVSVLLGKGDGSFLPAQSYSAGSYPHAVAVGDFNGDGIPDLAVADGAGTVSILLGNGDGTFRAPVSFAAGKVPASVAVGDFNGDGLPDLAVANEGSVPNYNDSSVSVLLGNGDGSFQAAVNYAAGKDPKAVAVGDFNGDGTPDLAVANFLSNTVSVLLGNGDGSFLPAINSPAGSSPWSVAVADFNGDGAADLAVADDGCVRVLLGNGDGTFQTTLISYLAGSWLRSVEVGDFNGDGAADLAVANYYSKDVSILLNDGNWGGASPVASPGPPRRAPRATPANAAQLPGILPSALGTTGLPACLGEVQPAPEESSMWQASPAALAPLPLPAAPAPHTADRVFAAPARAWEAAPLPGWLPDADLDGLVERS
jgi:hypothetical protein